MHHSPWTLQNLMEVKRKWWKLWFNNSEQKGDCAFHWAPVESTLVHVEIGSPVVFLLPSGLMGLKQQSFCWSSKNGCLTSAAGLYFTFIAPCCFCSEAFLNTARKSNSKFVCEEKKKITCISLLADYPKWFIVQHEKWKWHFSYLSQRCSLYYHQ